MGLYRVSVFFQQKGDRTGGWTTNFWNNADSDAVVVTRINALTTLMQNMAGFGCDVVKARYAVVPGFRVADEVLYTYNTVPGTNTGVNADYQNTAVGVRLIGAGKYVANIWISGTPDQAVANAGRLQGQFTASASWKAFSKYLVSGGDGWIMYCLDKGRAKKGVTGIAINGTVTCPAHGFDGTLPVAISNVHGPGRPRGYFRITNITPTTFDLVGYSNPLAPALTIKKAIARAQTFLQVAIASVVAKRATSHKRGRPTDLLSGKPKKAAV
jgi:hypothetical protein